LAGQLPAMLAQACGARVDWRLVARSGLNTVDTWRLLQREPLPQFDVVLVVTGVNDVIE